MIETERYSAKWIQMAPGEKTRTQFYGDDRTVWVVWGGKIRFTIKGQQPFIAEKGFLVQVPLRVPYSMETVGDEPSLRFEVTRGGTACRPIRWTAAPILAPRRRPRMASTM